MTINDLMNGDIVVMRNGEPGVVIFNNNEKYLLFQSGGWESLDYYSEDMVYMYCDDDDPMDAIMQVYRSGSGIGFLYLEDEEIIYERDCTWSRPKKKKFRQKTAKAVPVKINQDLIVIVSRQFYGNRTQTEIRRENVNPFLLGRTDSNLSPEEYNAIRRKVVKVPGTENVVIVYDQNQEDKYINKTFPELYAELGESYRANCGKEMTMIVSCDIPEIGFKIHTRCFACRMDEAGQFQSLESEDFEKFMRYFPN